MKDLDLLLDYCAIQQKKGLHFIIASVVIWAAILFIHLSSLPILTKNLLTFFATAPLMPLAFGISKLIGVQFQNKENPLSKAGVVFSINQMLYLLIAMWIFPTIPDKMVMVLAMIFGAHLFPFGWLYKSMSYYTMSVIIPIVALIIGNLFSPYMIAATMIVIEIIFVILLVIENKKLIAR